MEEKTLVLTFCWGRRCVMQLNTSIIPWKNCQTNDKFSVLICINKMKRLYFLMTNLTTVILKYR